MAVVGYDMAEIQHNLSEIKRDMTVIQHHMTSVSIFLVSLKCIELSSVEKCATQFSLITKFDFFKISHFLYYYFIQTNIYSYINFDVSVYHENIVCALFTNNEQLFFSS